MKYVMIRFLQQGARELFVRAERTDLNPDTFDSWNVVVSIQNRLGTGFRMNVCYGISENFGMVYDDGEDQSQLIEYEA